MKIKVMTTLLLFYTFALQAQQVKLYTEVSFDNGITSYNGQPYTGQVMDTDATGHLTYQGNYKDGKAIGEVKAWYVNSGVKGTPEFDYNYDENGLLSGTSTDYCKNGQKLNEINYLHGKKDGRTTYYDTTCTGVEDAEMNYKADSLEGNWIRYKNGVKRYVDKYENGNFIGNEVYTAEGKPDSTWTTYDESGVVSHTYWHNGVQDKYQHYVVANYTFNSANSFLMKIPASASSTIDAEFIVNNPAPQNVEYNQFINKIWTYMVKMRGAKFIKQVDFHNYSTDTISYIVNMTNIKVAYTTHRFTNSYGTVSAQYTVDLDADIITTDIMHNTTSTVHLHSNTPAIGISQNSSSGAYGSAMDRDMLKTGTADYLATQLPLKATLTQITSSSKDAEAETVTLNIGSAVFVSEDMKFKYNSATQTDKEPIELRVKSVEPNQCTCKVLNGGAKITEMVKQGVMLVFVEEK